MKRLGENVFRFKVLVGLSLYSDLGFFVLMPGVGVVIAISGLKTDLLLAIIFIVASVFLFTLWLKNTRDVILDKDRGVILKYKWRWNITAPPKYEEIPIDEILGVNQDIDIKTETKLVNKGTSRASWETTHTKTYNIVLQGKFGSRRFSMVNKDDWNLFMTLLCAEDDGEDEEEREERGRRKGERKEKRKGKERDDDDDDEGDEDEDEDGDEDDGDEDEDEDEDGDGDEDDGDEDEDGDDDDEDEREER